MVARTDTPAGTQFRAIQPAEVLQRLSFQFNDGLALAERKLREMNAFRTLDGPDEDQLVWNAAGDRSLAAQARGLIEGARESLMLVLWPQEVELLRQELARCEHRGVQVLTLCCSGGCGAECRSRAGETFCFGPAQDPSSRTLVVLPDRMEVLVGLMQTSGQTLALRTRNLWLVQMTEGTVKQAISHGVVMRDLGERAGEVLSLETLDVLRRFSL